jgi:hypothetical protein
MEQFSKEPYSIKQPTSIISDQTLQASWERSTTQESKQNSAQV